VQPFYLFTAFNIPVRVSPFFLLILWLFGRQRDLQAGMIWGLCITVSILVHEFGHALVARRLGLGPDVLLHGFGGRTAHSPAETRMDDALIVASGPAAGLLLGVLTLLVLFVLRLVAPEALAEKAVAESIEALLFVNLGWSVFNLLPMWPLDGGLLLRLGAQKVLPSAATADRITHITALCLIAALVLWMVSSQMGFWTLIMLLLLAWENYQALQGQRSSGQVHKSYGRGASMLREVRDALASGNAREAARRAHVTRSSADLSQEQLAELWGLLGVATSQLGEHEEALSYLRRAPRGAAVDAATRACLEALGRHDELPVVSAAQTLRKPPTARRRWLWVVVTFDLLCMSGAVFFYFGM
jgi:stage IV sporulation protein FB